MVLQVLRCSKLTHKLPENVSCVVLPCEAITECWVSSICPSRLGLHPAWPCCQSMGTCALWLPVGITYGKLDGREAREWGYLFPWLFPFKLASSRWHFSKNRYSVPLKEVSFHDSLFPGPSNHLHSGLRVEAEPLFLSKDFHTAPCGFTTRPCLFCK